MLSLSPHGEFPQVERYPSDPRISFLLVLVFAFLFLIPVGDLRLPLRLQLLVLASALLVVIPEGNLLLPLSLPCCCSWVEAWGFSPTKQGTEK